MATRRIGAETSATRVLILDETERMMIAQGYARVSTRKVAAAAGLTPPLVHYYFPTTDDLFLAVYHRAVGRVMEQLEEALASPRPLHALWDHACDPHRTTLASEFLALANHRKAIKAEIAIAVERHRERQSELLAGLLPNGTPQAPGLNPSSFALLIAAVARALVMEESLGIGLGHGQLRTLAMRWLDHVEPDGGPPGRSKRADVDHLFSRTIVNGQ